MSGEIRRTLGGLVAEARARLSGAGVVEAALDARILVETATGHDQAAVIARPGTAITAEAYETAMAMVERRAAGEPVHRILGWREFHGLRLRLSPDVLEPRPDTETLVDRALVAVRAIADRLGGCDILDLGTGSGAIALALLAAEPRARAVGADISQGAIATARLNAEANGLGDRFRPVLSDWFGAISGRFHVIVANPPYIRTADIAGLSREVRMHDPAAALDGGADGLDAYRAIAGGALEFMEPEGHLLVEIGYDQAIDVRTLFEEHGFRCVGLWRDLAGTPRVLEFLVAAERCDIDDGTAKKTWQLDS
jgi:release factor glutamine methyltransferase